MNTEMMMVMVIVGIVLLVTGFFIGRVSVGQKVILDEATEQALKKAEHELEKVKKELADYRHEVSSHFGKTADLVDQLTEDYKAVFVHLGQSAKNLLSEAELKAQIMAREAKTLSYDDDSKTVKQEDVTAKATKETKEMQPDVNTTTTQPLSQAERVQAENRESKQDSLKV